ncbi:hypothetical protein CROQUDRAFT_135343 [Cronartium quercuum f. sp. fusiforme G11]|uniref:Uncharacterized protein n=1 Tax=Cronartium quercuum f. sp. fusiforme G11 TaxID=708437 RepID=A0A9P6NF01_9BASI|nr:hypothetical protein CROQUDRAFT_135343 [Cronartium quercuum f. sp. fusiforme G11]
MSFISDKARPQELWDLQFNLIRLISYSRDLDDRFSRPKIIRALKNSEDEMTQQSPQLWIGLKEMVNARAGLRVDRKTVIMLWVMVGLAPPTCLLYMISMIKRSRTVGLWQSQAFREGYLSPQAAVTIPTLMSQDIQLPQFRGLAQALRVLTDSWMLAWAVGHALPPSYLTFNTSRLPLNLTRAPVAACLVVIQTCSFFGGASTITLLALARQKKVIQECFAHRQRLVSLDYNVGVSTAPQHSETGPPIPLDDVFRSCRDVKNDTWTLWWLPSIRGCPSELQWKIWQLPQFDVEHDWSAKDRIILREQYFILRWCTVKLVSSGISTWNPDILEEMKQISCLRAFTPLVNFPKEPKARPGNFERGLDDSRQNIGL